VKELTGYMPSYDKFDFRYTNETMSFDQFNDYIFDYGRKNAPEMPFFYCAYSFYEVDTTRNQYMFYNFLNMTNQDGAGLYP
jgi:hypothetical protein